MLIVFPCNRLTKLVHRLVFPLSLRLGAFFDYFLVFQMPAMCAKTLSLSHIIAKNFVRRSTGSTGSSVGNGARRAGAIFSTVGHCDQERRSSSMMRSGVLFAEQPRAGQLISTAHQQQSKQHQIHIHEYHSASCSTVHIISLVNSLPVGGAPSSAEPASVGARHPAGAVAIASSSSSSLATSSRASIRSKLSPCTVPVRSMASQCVQAQFASANQAEEAPEPRPGPPEWAVNFPIALYGQRQSPIDIRTSSCSGSSSLAPLVSEYPKSIGNLSIVNGGYGWRVDIPAETGVTQTSLRGGPLEDNYVLEQFHAHWGSECACGSEHTVDGHSYDAELHLVHWNRDKFQSFPEAAAHDKGLAVLGVFLKVGDEPHPEFEKLTKLMADIRYKSQTASLSDELTIDNLLPKERGYWTYEGSLTTPPLYESVTWIVFKQPISVTKEQIAQCRVLCYHDAASIPVEGEHKVEQNFRPPQPLCSRGVASVV